MPFINEAAYAVLEGVAEPEAIDTIAKLGFAHPMGPLALADLIGLDTCVAIMEVLQHGLGDQKYAPCPLLRQYVQAGRLGRSRARLLHIRTSFRGFQKARAGDEQAPCRCRCRARGDGEGTSHLRLLSSMTSPALRELLRATFEGADVGVDEASRAWRPRAHSPPPARRDRPRPAHAGDERHGAVQRSRRDARTKSIPIGS